MLSFVLCACSEATHLAPATGAGGTGGGAGAAMIAGGKGGDTTGETAGRAGHVAASGGSDASGGTAGGGATGGGATGGGGGAHTPPPCTVVAPAACPDPMPTYADVEPIFSERCVVCHMGSADGPWPLTNYGHVASWADDIRAMLLTCAMPPPEERTPLPNDESLLLLTWIRCGLPP